MRMKLLLMTMIPLLIGTIVAYAGSKQTGEKCIGDAECEFGNTCSDGVCTKKKEFDFGSSGKTGKPCQIDADCIGSGKCVEGDFGKKHCSGN